MMAVYRNPPMGQNTWTSLWAAVLCAVAGCSASPVSARAAAGALSSDSNSNPAAVNPEPGGPSAPEAPARLLIHLQNSGAVQLPKALLKSPSEVGTHIANDVADPSSALVEVSPGTPPQLVSELVAELRQAGITDVQLQFLAQGEAPAVAASPPTPIPGPPAWSPPPGKSLPKLVIHTVGLHIGGGPNDDDTRAFFRAPIEKRFNDFRRCYPLVDEPGESATVGVDLLIGRNGGKPDVRQPRTGTGGVGFRECMVGAFARTRFPKPARGPTVISYSMRFTLEGHSPR
ncbi:hypothetical protein ACFL5O_06240 [Myxococcota bacterium]